MGSEKMSISYPDLNLTTFPETVDVFIQMLDVVAADSTALKAYQDAMNIGNIIQANTALQTMANATQKILTAQKVNKIFDSIEALERFLATDIVPYVAQLQSNWQVEVDKFSYKGEYSATVAYEKNNIVSYTSGAYTFLYLCISDTDAGILPTNTVYWQRFTVVGLRGLSGIGMSFLYEWDASTTYSPQDTVTYGGKVWGCVNENDNSAPSTTNVNWQLLMDISPSVYPVQTEEPGGQNVGDIWFKVISINTSHNPRP